MTEKDKIQFKPLHEGMGFHPFSDGLPYAPESKTKYGTQPGKQTTTKLTSGAGATSAGRPQFVTQSFSSTQKPLGTARQLQKIQPQRNQQIALQKTQISPSLHSQPQSQAILQKHRELQKESDLEAFIIRRRFFAYLLDTVVHAGFWIGVNLTALFAFNFQIDSALVQENFPQFIFFFAISQWMFVALQEMLFENSIGKVFFELEFKRNHRSLLFRSLVFVAGILFFGLGLKYRPQDKFGTIQLKS